MIKKRLCIFSIVLLLTIHLIVQNVSIVKAQTEDIVNRGTYSVTNVKTGDSLSVADDTAAFNMTSEDDFSQQNFQFVYDRCEEAYRIYIIEDTEIPSKVLDIVRIDKEIASGCSVSACYLLITAHNYGVLLLMQMERSPSDPNTIKIWHLLLKRNLWL